MKSLSYLRHRNGEAEELRARGMPLGLMPAMRYEQKEVVLDAGDSAFFYSDGLVEAHDPKGEMFGFPSWRNFTPSLGRTGSRRTTSPSLYATALLIPKLNFREL
jgi:serine phosphatase RsbU (regulator of sigma subunit)